MKKNVALIAVVVLMLLSSIALLSASEKNEGWIRAIPEEDSVALMLSQMDAEKYDLSITAGDKILNYKDLNNISRKVIKNLTPDTEYTAIVTIYNSDETSKQLECTFKTLKETKKPQIVAKEDEEPKIEQPKVEEAKGLLYDAKLPKDMPKYTGEFPKIKSESNICILVNKEAQIVTVFGKASDGQYRKVLRNMICSTGKVSSRTPIGEQNIREKALWYKWGTDSYSAYNLYLKGNLKFHSVLFKKKNLNTRPMSDIVAKLGQPASAGCIRLTVEDAEWLYKRAKVGTPAIIIEGEEMPELHKYLKSKVN